jgi:hypothetical protein
MWRSGAAPTFTGHGPQSTSERGWERFHRDCRLLSQRGADDLSGRGEEAAVAEERWLVNVPSEKLYFNRHRSLKGFSCMFAAWSINSVKTLREFQAVIII